MGSFHVWWDGQVKRKVWDKGAGGGEMRRVERERQKIIKKERDGKRWKFEALEACAAPRREEGDKGGGDKGQGGGYPLSTPHVCNTHTDFIWLK